MKQKSQQELFIITVVLESGKTKDVKVRASKRKIAERRALKRSAGVKIFRGANA